MTAKLVIVVLGALASTTAFEALSQTYPSKTIRFITAGVGGGNDFTARLIAPELSAAVGQPVVVDNRASSTVSGEAVAKSAPDGYALLVAGGTFTIGPLMQQMPYDVLRDFAPVAMIGSAPNILTVHPSLPVKTVKDLIVLARSKPGDINYSSGNPGASSHLSAELLKYLARINIMAITYKSSGPAVIALLGGEVQIMFPNMPTAAPHLKSGRMKALAVTSAQPSTLLPGVPTVASTVPGYEATSMDGIYAPAKTPAAVVGRLNQEIARVVHKPEVKERFFNAGVEVVGSTPEQLDRAVKDELALWGKVIKEAGLKFN